MSNKPLVPEIGLYTVAGVSGLKQQGGRLQVEWKEALKGNLGPKKFREMADNNAYVRLGLTMLSLLQARPRKRVRCANDGNPAAVAAARFLEEALEDMHQPFGELLQQADSMNIYGWAAFEVVYKRRAGLAPPDGGAPSRYTDRRIGWAGWYLRNQETRERWEFDLKTSEPVALHQWDPSTGQRARLPFRDERGVTRLLNFTTESASGSPEGRSFARSIHVEYEHQKHNLQMEGIRAQRDVTGVLDIQAPMTAWTDPDLVRARTNLEEMAAQYSLSERAFFLRPAETLANGQPSGWKIGTLTSSGPAAVDYDKIIRRTGGNILMAFFSELAAMGTSAGGTMALGETKAQVTTLACEALNRRKEDVINRDAVPSLMLLNGWADPNLWPWVEFDPIRPQDPWKILDVANRLLMSGGLTPQESLEAWVRDILGAPAFAGEWKPPTNNRTTNTSNTEVQHAGQDPGGNEGPAGAGGRDVQGDEGAGRGEAGADAVGKHRG